jgi:hypothetical protein
VTQSTADRDVPRMGIMRQDRDVCRVGTHTGQSFPLPPEHFFQFPPSLSSKESLTHHPEFASDGCVELSFTDKEGGNWECLEVAGTQRGSVVRGTSDIFYRALHLRICVNARAAVCV